MTVFSKQTMSGVGAVALFGVSMSMNFHILVHFASLLLAVVLATISVASYRRVLRRSLLLVSLAFISLAAEEFVVLAQALSWVGTDFINLSGSAVELSHVMTLVSLGLFSSGLIRRE